MPSVPTLRFASSLCVGSIGQPESKVECGADSRQSDLKGVLMELTSSVPKDYTFEPAA
jgi:hypothetical protein